MIIGRDKGVGIKEGTGRTTGRTTKAKAEDDSRSVSEKARPEAEDIRALKLEQGQHEHSATNTKLRQN